MTAISDTILKNTKGVRVTLRDPAVCQILQPYADFFVLDPVAHALSPDMLQTMLLVARDKPVLVRTEDSAPATLQKYLNWGVDGLILPDIHHAADAEKALAACLYPPEGVRPYRPMYNADETSLGVLNDQMTIIIEISQPQAVANIEDIADTPGLDGFLVSPKALSVAMELEGELDHPQLTQALTKVVATAKANEILCGFEDVLSDALQPDFYVLASDIALLQKAARQVLGEVEEPENQGGLRALR